MRLAIYFFVFVMAMLPTVNLSAVTTVNQTTTGISVFGSETINNDDVKPKKKKKKKKGKKGGMTAAKIFKYLFLGSAGVTILGVILAVVGVSQGVNAVTQDEIDSAAGLFFTGFVLGWIFGVLSLITGTIWLIMALVNS